MIVPFIDENFNVTEQDVQDFRAYYVIPKLRNAHLSKQQDVVDCVHHKEYRLHEFRYHLTNYKQFVHLNVYVTNSMSREEAKIFITSCPYIWSYAQRMENTYD